MFGAWLSEKWCSGFGDVGVLVWRRGALGVERLSTKAGAFNGTFGGSEVQYIAHCFGKNGLILHSLKSRKRRKKRTDSRDCEILSIRSFYIDYYPFYNQ